jgi:hypothetical protein
MVSILAICDSLQSLRLGKNRQRGSNHFMYQYYFPTCSVEGSIDPVVPFKHFHLSGAVPNKCGSCHHLFEGECLRAIDELQRYLKLDYGFCGIYGSTEPVYYENQFVISKFEIPSKCASCVFFNPSNFNCGKDPQKWGEFLRGLDWGYWQPESVYIALPFPKKTTKVLINCLKNNNLVGFIKEYRSINPGSILEAKDDFYYLKNISEESNIPRQSDNIDS